jgi:DNA-binding protein YbaB
MKEDIGLKVLDAINNGRFDELEPFFGSFENAFSFLKKKDLFHLLDYTELPSNYVNEYVHFLLSEKEYRPEILKKLIGKLDVIEEGGNYYIREDGEDLADLFKSYSRETSPYDVAKAVLSEDNWEPYYETTDNVYRDVIEELNPENIEYLKDRILKDLKDVNIDITTRSSDLMGTIASEQGHPEYFTIDSSNVDRIIKDEETMEELLRDELNDLNSDLYNIHSNAFNSAYESEVYDEVWDELYTHIDKDTAKNDWVKIGNRYYRKLKVTNHIEQVIDDWFDNYKGYADDFDYYGSYLGIIKQLMDEGNYERLSFRIPEYPDFRSVQKNINEFFGDYI